MSVSWKHKKNAGVAIAILALFILPLFLSQLGKTGQFWTWVVTEMIIMALYVMSLNLVLGYGGMVSFGHAAFFGVGAYTLALLMKNAGLSLILALLGACGLAAVAAWIIGWFCVRLFGLYSAMLTLAFAQLIYIIALKWYDFTGGDDGIHGIPVPAFLSPVNYYLVCLTVFIACLLIMKIIINSSFGLTIRIIRENAERAKFIGINVRRYQLINFIIAGAFAGLAGGLFAELNRFVQTEFLHWSKSGDAVLACLVGGMYSFIGPAIGSTVLIFLRIILQQLHQDLVQSWAIFLGIILLAVVLFAPDGFVGLYNRLLKKTQRNAEMNKSN